MLSPPPALTSTAAGRPQAARRVSRSRPTGLREDSTRREEFGQAGIDEVQDRLAPLARAHVKHGRARGVAVLHALLAGEPEVEVVVREQDGAGRAEVGGFVLLEPEKLGRGVARQHDVARERDDLVAAAELAVELIALCGPWKCRTQSLAGRTGWLSSLRATRPCCWPLTPMARTSLRRSPSFTRHSRITASDAFHPGLGVLLEVTGGKPLDEPVGLLRRGENGAALHFEGKAFGALRAAVEAEANHLCFSVSGLAVSP